MNYFRLINKEKIHIDFVVHGFEKGIYDDEILAAGSKLYNVPVKSKDFYGNQKALKKIIMENQYQIIHSHMDAMSSYVLRIAKKCGIPIRIAHSHNTRHLTKNFLKIFLNEIARLRIRNYATHYVACSKEAGIWLFGKEKHKNEIMIIHNAINVEKHFFSEAMRLKLRKELCLKDDFVIGNIGRFDYQKNHSFLLDVFSDLAKTQSNIKLILIGDGHLRNEIKEKISKLDLKEKVVLLGSIDNINEYLNVFDIFCLPSIFEGLGIVIVEALANGLKVLASDKVPKESNINGEVRYIELEKAKWLKELEFNMSIMGSRNEVKQEMFIEKGYEIKDSVKSLESYYLCLSKL